jgi:glycosyltransferase involved in cell wall biosynthesis
MAARVSVLLPVYNCELYLQSALDSISAQTFEDFEVVAVNDGSRDGSGDILDAHANRDGRFRPVHTKNGGIVAALNLALEKAEGEYSARMDGDDIARGDRFAEQVGFLDAHPDCVSVGSLYRVINSQGEVVGGQAPFKRFRQTDLENFPPHVATTPHPSIMLRTEALRKVGGYRSKFPHAEDYDMFLRICRLGRVDIIQKQLLDYRIHDFSVSSENINVQTDSSLLAVLSALSVQNGLPDPADKASRVGFEDYYALYEDRRFVRAFEAFRRHRQIESHFNRWDKVKGRQLALKQFADLVSGLPMNLGDKRYLGMLKTNTRLVARALLGRA